MKRFISILVLAIVGIVAHAQPSLVTPVAITGVTSPVALAYPSKDIDNGYDFMADLTWNGSPTTFDYSTKYPATITLTAASGFTFSGNFTDES